MDEEKRKGEEEEMAGRKEGELERRLSEGQIERRLEERLREAQVEREARQRELIQQVTCCFNIILCDGCNYLMVQARREEQEAIEEGERRVRAKRQVDLLSL